MYLGTAKLIPTQKILIYVYAMFMFFIILMDLFDTHVGGYTVIAVTDLEYYYFIKNITYNVSSFAIQFL